jgi:hypothetical protein
VYAGKKQRHTLKRQVATEVHGELLAIDAGHPGPSADNGVYDRSVVPTLFPDAVKQGDLAYLGAAGVVTPQRKARGGPVTAEQQGANPRKASVRVHVEHDMRRLKACHMQREPYRHALGLFVGVAAVAGLVRFGRLTALG